MSALQWAVLIFAVIAVVAIYFFSRREGSSVPPPPITNDDDDPLFKPSPRARQMDIFTAPGPAAKVPPVAAAGPLAAVDATDSDRGSPPRAAFKVAPSTGPSAAWTAGPAATAPTDDFAKDFSPRLPPIAKSPSVAAASEGPLAGVAARGPIVSSRNFDELGVGEPRRIPPLIGTPPPLDDAARSRPAPSSRAFAPVASSATSPPAPRAAGSRAAEKIISLLIIARNGGAVGGEAVHAALRAQGLQYGQKQIYHRLHEGKTVFSVASMLKPGTLEPEQAHTFSAPGLAVFMVLPGALPPMAALRDMIKSSQAIARALNADVFDGKRQPLTMVATRALHEEIESWEADRTT